MAWDFETDPAFEEQLAWSQQLVRDEVIPLETLRLGLRGDTLKEVLLGDHQPA